MTPIAAPDDVIHAWREESGRALHASRLANDPHIVDVLRFTPRELGELVADMSEALSHASEILLASVANATPSAPCPIPDPGGTAYPCQCEPEARAGCDRIAYEIGAGTLVVPDVVVDNGCEGGVA